MENSSEITANIINTINTIFENLFSSIDNNLYKILDELIFVNEDILNDKYFSKIFGTSTANGILLVANSLLIGIVLYYAAKYMLANFTYEKIENPFQFFFQCILFGICMNSSFFIIQQILSLNFNICSIIKELGEDLWGKNIGFAELITEINENLDIHQNNIDIFTLDGLIKGTLTISLLNLVFSYSLRYIMIKIFILLSPFAFLSLMIKNLSHFFKSWFRNFFSLLLIQIMVSFVLLLLFSMDYTKDTILNKFIYVGGIYALIRANSIVKELFGGISTTIQSGITNLRSFTK